MVDSIGISDTSGEVEVLTRVHSAAARVKERILFRLGEWFLDAQAGTPFPDNERIVTNAILEVEDVTGVRNVSFEVDAQRRAYYSAEVLTIFGPTTVGPIHVNRP